MTVEVEIRRIDDETLDFEPSVKPADVPDSSGLRYRTLFIEMGPKGSQGSNYFYSKFLVDEGMLDNEPYRFHFGRVIGKSFSMTKYRATIEAIAQSIEAETWDEFAKRMTPYMHWEYDGYTP